MGSCKWRVASYLGSVAQRDGSGNSQRATRYATDGPLSIPYTDRNPKSDNDEATAVQADGRKDHASQEIIAIPGYRIERRLGEGGMGARR